MAASPGQPLWLLSIQVTLAGSAAGFRLPELLDSVRAKIAGSRNSESFEGRLRELRWDEANRDLYLTKWRLRSTPAVYEVAADFPALTPAALATLPMAVEEIAEVRYRLDLTNRAPNEPPEIIGDILWSVND